MAAANVTINNVLPGMFDTDRLRGTTERLARAQGTSPEAMAHTRMEQVPARRFGTAEEFGEVCAFLCSRQAGYITGQNILVDGGYFRSTF